MENSMLGKISKFVKDNDITINDVYVRITDNFLERYTPAFYDAIIKYMKLTNFFYSDENKIESFFIRITENKNVYLELLGTDGYTKVIVIQDFVKYNKLPGAKIVKESDFVNTIKHIDAQKNLEMLKILSNNFKKRFIKNTKDIMTIETVLEHMADEFISYIYYLEKEKQENIDKIYFVESESSNIVTKNEFKESK